MSDDTGPSAAGWSVHDRLAERRSDARWLGRAWSDAMSAVLVAAPDTVAMDGDRLRRLQPGEAPAGERVLLGAVDGRTHLAVLVPRVPEQLQPRGVRAAAAGVGAVDAGLLFHLAGLANWHAAHPRCARCGAATDVVDAGHARRCPTCAAMHFPRTDPAVIVLLTDQQDRALLARQPGWAPHRFSTLAGFVEPGESLEDAVHREIQEEVGLAVDELGYARSQPWPFPSSLMLAFFARTSQQHITVDGHEIVEADWFTRDRLTQLTGSGAVTLPPPMSVSRWLIQTWHAGNAARLLVSRLTQRVWP